MPRDAEFGRDLANQLSTVFLGLISSVEFTYDAWLELEDVDPGKSWCKITPNLYQHVRESRHQWRETIELVVTLVSNTGAASSEAEIDAWLDSWDTVVRQMRELKLLGKHKPIAVNIEERYDSDLFHNYKRLVTQALINYQNVEVI